MMKSAVVLIDFGCAPSAPAAFNQFWLTIEFYTL